MDNRNAFKTGQAARKVENAAAGRSPTIMAARMRLKGFESSVDRMTSAEYDAFVIAASAAEDEMNGY